MAKLDDGWCRREYQQSFHDARCEESGRPDNKSKRPEGIVLFIDDSLSAYRPEI